MKNPEEEQHFLLTSPQQELKQLSYAESVEKPSPQSLKLNKRQNEKFAIESWNISQKLKSCQKQADRYKDTISTKLTLSYTKNRHRAQSAFLRKDIQNQNNHNFSNKRRSIGDVGEFKKGSSFLGNYSLSFQRSKMVSQQSRQKSIQSKKPIFKKRKLLQRELMEQQQCRMKTIQSYLTHQKQQINRQKAIIYSQRTGTQSMKIVEYPTQYWQKTKCNSSLGIKIQKKRLSNAALKRKMIILSERNMEKSQTIIYNNNLVSERYQKKVEKCSQEVQNIEKLKSPIKRFQLFMDKLHRGIHAI